MYHFVCLVFFLFYFIFNFQILIVCYVQKKQRLSDNNILYVKYVFCSFFFRLIFNINSKWFQLPIHSFLLKWFDT